MILKIGLFASALSIAFLCGWKFNGWRYQAKISEAESLQRQTILDVRKAQDVSKQLLSELHAEKSREQEIQTKVITRDVIKYVQNPSAGRCDLPDDWVRIVNAAAGLSTADTTGHVIDITGKPNTD